MTDEPEVWHYGLMAEHWAEFSIEAREAPFFLQEIARYGQPVLDMGCGTGASCCRCYVPGLISMAVTFQRIC